MVLTKYIGLMITVLLGSLYDSGFDKSMAPNQGKVYIVSASQNLKWGYWAYFFIRADSVDALLLNIANNETYSLKTPNSKGQDLMYDPEVNVVKLIVPNSDRVVTMKLSNPVAVSKLIEFEDMFQAKVQDYRDAFPNKGADSNELKNKVFSP